MRFLMVNNRCLLVILFIGFISCSTNTLSRKQCKEHEVVTYFSSGKIKASIAMCDDKKHGDFISFYPDGNKYKVGRYNNDSVVFMLTFDSLEKKIEDERKIFHSIQDENFELGDTVEIEFWIEGPDTNKMMLLAAGMKIYPDTSIRFKRYLKQDSFYSKDAYIFIPTSSGRYEVDLDCIEGAFMKSVGHKEVIIDVK